MKPAKAFIIPGLIILLFVFSILMRYIFEKYKLDLNHKYVIGRLKEKENGVKGGTRYIYQFKYLNKYYEKTFSGEISNLSLGDSMMYFKIYPDDPNISRQIDGIRVPKCLSILNMPIDGWETIPTNPCK